MTSSLTTDVIWSLALPLMLGAALLLIVLAQRPPRGVAIGAWIFAAVCFVLGLVQAQSGYAARQKAVAVMACLQKYNRSQDAFAKCNGGNAGFVGNEAFSGE